METLHSGKIYLIWRSRPGVAGCMTHAVSAPRQLAAERRECRWRPTFRKRAASGLQTGRGFVLPNEQEQVHEKTDLELITWLVIKDGKTD